MSNEPTKEEVLASIVSRTDQLNAQDLESTGPITFTVKSVKRGSKEQPIEIALVEDERFFRPCKTVRRCLIALWSDDAKSWIGKQLTIYTDPSVMYAGVRIGGLRVSHVSGIDCPKTLLLTKTRGKRSEVTVYPIQTPKDDAQIKEALAEIAAAETAEALKAVGFVLKQRPKAVQDAVRPAYKERLKALNPPVSALQAFEAEIEEAKGSKKALAKLSVRCNEFQDEGPALYERIEKLYATAAEDE
ncbi:MAG: hypothetical protein V1755_06655 [Chloroflexota bacterium]